MKQIVTTIKTLSVLALLALAVGCASDMHEKENAAIAAGFKIITPTKPDQVALLPTLPKDKVTEVNYHGKTYYVLPDAKNNQAYVGGPQQLQAYKALRAQQKIANDNLMAAQMNQAASMNWGAWGGWGGGWGPGWY